MRKSMPYTTSSYYQIIRPLILIFILSLSFFLLSGCSPRHSSKRPQPATPPPLPSTQIYFYPQQGQNKAQQERDRYECYLWAVRQSGFDPNQSQRLAPHQRVTVKMASPSGSGAVSGAIGGAVLGSIVTPYRHSGEGLVFGAIAGALIGAASDVARQQKINKAQQQYAQKNANNYYARQEKQARDYRRAMSACLEGRGYSVQ